MLRRILLPVLSTIVLAPAPLVAQTAPAPMIAPQKVQTADQSVATILPDNTAGVFLINTNEALWSDLSQFGLFPRDMSFPSWLYSFTGVNFFTAVKPWLGEQVGIALLPEGGKNRVVTIASVKDSNAIAPFLEAIQKSKKEQPIQHQHQGITILEWKPEKPAGKEATPAPIPPPLKKLNEGATVPKLPNPFQPAGFAIAVLPNHVVTATSIEPIQQLIDAQAANKPLSNNPLFQKTVARSQYSKSLLVGYGGYVELMKALDAQIDQLAPSAPKMPKLDPEKLDVLGAYYDAIDGYVWAEPDGLHFNMGINFKKPVPESLLEKMQTRNEILERLPEVNYVVSNSYNLALFWQVLITGLEAEPTFKKQIDQFRQVAQTSVGIDDRDIFPWMNQGIAAFMYPTRQGFIPNMVPNLDLGFGLMIQTSDRKAAETTLSKVDAQLKKFGIPATTNAATQSTSFSVPMAGKDQSLLSHSWVAPDTLLILTGGGAVSELNPTPKRTLPQSSNFRSAIAPFAESNLGYFYVNAGATMTLINNSILPIFVGQSNPPYLEATKAALGTVRSISGASSITSEKIQADGFLALASSRRKPMTASELIDLGHDKRFKDSEGAIANFTRALNLEPQNVQALTGRASVVGDRNPRAALDDLNQAILLAPNDADALAQRSDVRERLFDYQGALEDISQAITQQPTQPIFYVQRSNTRIAVEDYKGAIADADIALKTEEFSTALNNRCYARARGFGEFKAALSDCEKAVEANPESPAYLASRCYVRANLKDKKALEDCDKAIALDPEYGYNYEDRGLAKAALGDQAGALADLQRAADSLKQLGDTVSQERVEKEIMKIK